MAVLVLGSLGVGFTAGDQDVYVIPIKGEINSATYAFLKDTIDGIDETKTKAIIFEIDTYGGLIDQASNIKEIGRAHV